MTQTSHQAAYDILVAYDGSDEGMTAVRYAAGEARRAGMPLRVIHVVPQWAPVGPLTPETSAGLNAAGSEFLAQARVAAAEVNPDLEVRTELCEGSRAGWIRERLGAASLVVLGRRRESRLDQIWRGGTIDAVASRSPCPVVVVPPDWTSERQGEVVVAGFKSSRHAVDLFAAAFGRADALGLPVEVLHAWQLPGVYDDIVAGRVDAQEWSDRQAEIVDEALVPWRESFPKVPVRVTVSHGVAASALIRASEHAARLVLVRPAHGGWAHHLGRTARAVLRFAACPIEVVVPGSGWELSGVPLSVEENGDVLR